jgi:hypothetical protein
MTYPHQPFPPPYPPAAYYPPSYPPSGSGLFTISLVRHTGMVVLWHNRTYRVTGTLPQCERAYRDAQIYNLAAGWWSLTSVLVMNWVSLLQNASAMRKLRRLAQQPPVWYPGLFQ